MDTNNNINITKNIGPKSAAFILSMYDKGKTIFSNKEASELVNLKDKSLQKFLNPLLKKGILNRIIPGLYTIVPFELGNTTEFVGNPYVVAKEIVRHKVKENEAYYFVSHASAFEIHQMVTQPHMDIYVTTTKQIKEKINVQGTEFHFVTSKKENFFGFKKYWITKSQCIYVSDLERTIIDGLKIPEYCGGMPEVSKGLWIRRSEINLDKLYEYARHIDSGIVYRRLGYLLETYKIGNSEYLNSLQNHISDSYQLFDPTQVNEGKYYSRWKLRLNITEEELLSLVRT